MDNEAITIILTICKRRTTLSALRPTDHEKGLTIAEAQDRVANQVLVVGEAQGAHRSGRKNYGTTQTRN